MAESGFLGWGREPGRWRSAAAAQRSRLAGSVESTRTGVPITLSQHLSLQTHFGVVTAANCDPENTLRSPRAHTPAPPSSRSQELRERSSVTPLLPEPRDSLLDLTPTPPLRCSPTSVPPRGHLAGQERGANCNGVARIPGARASIHPLGRWQRGAASPPESGRRSGACAPPTEPPAPLRAGERWVLSGPWTRVGRCRTPARCCGRHRVLAAAAGRLCSCSCWWQRFSFTRAGPAACHQRPPWEKAPDTPTALGPRIPKLKSSLDLRRSRERVYGDIGAPEASHLQHNCFPFLGEPGGALGGSTSPVEDPPSCPTGRGRSSHHPRKRICWGETLVWWRALQGERCAPVAQMPVAPGPQQPDKLVRHGLVATERGSEDMLSGFQEEMDPPELTRRLATVITHVDEIMQQEIRPFRAVDLIEQLHRQFAILSGGRGKDGAPIITFPEFVGFKHIPEEDFLNVMTYLTSIPSVEAASIGFVIVIDRRRDKWSSIKASLTRIAVAFPGNLQLIFILRPARFIQRAFTDIGIKYYQDEFRMKVPIVMLNSVADLHGYIDKSQLTVDLGGTLEYHHSQWMNHRTAIENFALTLKNTAQMLQTFGVYLAMAELPRGILSAEDLLMCHTRQRDQLQGELQLLVKQGATLLSCIQEPATKSLISKLNPSELENVTTMERLLVQLDQTEKAFSQFWFQHHLKLNQCLQLQHFEHNFCEVKLVLNNLLAEQAEFTDNGDSVMHVEQLLREHKTLERKGQEPLEKAQLLALVGDQLIQSHHYAVDSIRPRCAELRHLCDDFINENKKREEMLEKSLELHRQLDKVSQWCEAGIYLLASQAVDKCQSREGVDVALNDIEIFLGAAKDYQLPNPRDFYNQFELMLTVDTKAKAQKVLQKLTDVQEIFHKRQMSLMKLADRQTRPVQPVAPHPESSPKWVSPKAIQPSTVASLQKSSEGSSLEPDFHSLEKEGDEIKFDVKNEEILGSSHDGENPAQEQFGSPENLTPSRRIIRDLLETEESYIKEIKSIIDGYITPMDYIWLKHLIPDVLQNNKDSLFGNIRELYEFHNRTFLKELEKCSENPELLPCCFLKRKEDLQIYFKYHKNLPRAKAIWQECQDCAYFGVCQRQLDHNLPLFKYLGGPSERLVKYQQLLKGLLDLVSAENLEKDQGNHEKDSAKNELQRTKDSVFSDELQQAVTMMEDLIKSCELSVGLAAVTGCPDDIGKLGKLLMCDSFSVWSIHKDRSKMKDFIRFKPSQRQIYLFEKGLVFCKIRVDPSGQGLSPQHSFKKSMKLATLSIRQLGKGNSKKLEISSQNGLEKYILQAASKETKDYWFSAISKLLVQQQSIKGCSSQEPFSADIAEDRKAPGDMEKESSALSLSGLFQLDDSEEQDP
ncbi:probable guanine nucleotide exchange factor MCF2L2 [Suncus etruscus]|uniref:probable guanine nucleotide exchange factor MCF2L2 n=1 Tax=Suncus etruscus TaxID=109475 RepID=UPI002110C92F|nr:probable guanine nucleotide exchange factor MCF2L2 [Suncus etruscus]